jgi:long-subunit fatty acid transport protein
MSIDAAYMFLKEKQLMLMQAKAYQASMAPITYSADYKGIAHLIGTQLNMKF